MRGSFVRSAAFSSTMTAAARVAASLARKRALEKNASWPSPALSSEPTWRIRTLELPAMRPPSCDAICASVNGPGMSSRGRLALHHLDHPLGDVDARVRVGGFLENDVVLIRLGDLADDAVRLVDHRCQLLVAPLVDVLA